MAEFNDVKSQSPQFDLEQPKLVVNNKIAVNHGNTAAISVRRKHLLAGKGGFSGGKANYGLAWRKGGRKRLILALDHEEQWWCASALRLSDKKQVIWAKLLLSRLGDGGYAGSKGQN